MPPYPIVMMEKENYRGKAYFTFPPIITEAVFLLFLAVASAYVVQKVSGANPSPPLLSPIGKRFLATALPAT